MHFLEYTLSHRGKCVQPTGSGNIRWFVPETHARSEKQRTELASKLFCFRGESVRFFRVRAPTTPSTTRTTTTKTTTKKTELTDERSFGESPRDTSRAKILPGIHLGPSSRVVSEGSPPVVTACHVGSLKGQRHPEEL